MTMYLYTTIKLICLMTTIDVILLQSDIPEGLHPAVQTVLYILVGGGGLKLIETVWKRGANKKDDAMDALRAEIVLLKEKLDSQDSLISSLREQYSASRVQAKEYETALRLLTPFFDNK